MNHIFYQTKTKYSNTGDVLINHALIQALRPYGCVHANCSQGIPEQFLSLLGLQEQERTYAKSEFAFFKEILRCAREARKNGDGVYIFSGPGELSGGNPRMALRNAALGFVFPVLRAVGVKVVRIGRSVGPITRLMALSEWFRCLSLSHYFVRDTQSVQRCRKLGIRKAKLSADLSWIYDPQHPNRVNRTNVIMVNLRRSIYDHEVQDVFVEQTLFRCQELLDELSKTVDAPLRVCVAYQTADDRELSQQVYERLEKCYPTTFIDHQMRLDELAECYGGVDFHISNRMHSLLAGYKYGSLPLALVDTDKHIKVAVTFTDCGLEELLFDIYRPIDSQRLMDLVVHRDQMMDKLFACEEEKSQEIRETIRGIFAG